MDKHSMLQQMQTGRGFIAALDQSGGSTPGALKNYGVNKSDYTNQEQMFNLVHEMRTRIITSPVFTNQHILGVILFEGTVLSKIGDQFTAEYLWQNKQIVPFMKIDSGLAETANGVQLMRPILELDQRLDEANKHHVFGTKMRSVVHELNSQGIEEVVDQQFAIAEKICSAGLVPIIEPEVSVQAEHKSAIEQALKEQLKQHLANWDSNCKLICKLTIPTDANLYQGLLDFAAVVRVVALSGGYNVDQACQKLSLNHHMSASFSRALLQNLRAGQTDEQFNAALSQAIQQIYQSSIN